MNTSSTNINKESVSTSSKKIITGNVTAVRRSIVDIQFQEKLPEINSVVRTGDRVT